MAKYAIELTEDKGRSWIFREAHEKKLVISKIREQLADEPTRETRKKKVLRENPIAPWELRIGKYRVFYSVDEEIVTVFVVSLGWKDHNTLYIRGKQRARSRRDHRCGAFSQRRPATQQDLR